jgi:hypothetical protein
MIGLRPHGGMIGGGPDSGTSGLQVGMSSARRERVAEDQQTEDGPDDEDQGQSADVEIHNPMLSASTG